MQNSGKGDECGAGRQHAECVCLLAWRHIPHPDDVVLAPSDNTVHVITSSRAKYAIRMPKLNTMQRQQQQA